MNNQPLISIIIPVYNGARYIEAALDSIRAQTYQNYEIVLMDDGSTDGTAHIVQKHSDVRYFWQENAGGGPARNNAIRHSRGEYLTFLDADDLWSPDKLSKQWQAYQALPHSNSPKVLFGHAKQFFSPEFSEEKRARIRIPAEPQAAHLASTLFLSRADFDMIGPYSDGLGQCIDWFLKARDMGAQITTMPDTFLFRRIHDNNISRTKVDEKNQYARSIKASLDRRRAQNGGKL